MRVYMSFIFCILLAFAPGAIAFAEETETQKLNTLDWNIGLELASFRDDLIVPLGFHGPGVIIGSSFQHNQGEWQFNFPLSYKFDFLINRFSHMGMAFSLDVSPSLLRTVSPGESLGNFKAGLALPFKINNYFPFSWDDAHLYWFTIRSAAVVIEWTTTTASKRAIALRIEFPLVSQISRPPTYRHCMSSK